MLSGSVHPQCMSSWTKFWTVLTRNTRTNMFSFYMLSQIPLNCSFVFTFWALKHFSIANCSGFYHGINLHKWCNSYESIDIVRAILFLNLFRLMISSFMDIQSISSFTYFITNCTSNASWLHVLCLNVGHHWCFTSRCVVTMNAWPSVVIVVRHLLNDFLFQSFNLAPF